MTDELTKVFIAQPHSTKNNGLVPSFRRRHATGAGVKFTLQHLKEKEKNNFWKDLN